MNVLVQLVFTADMADDLIEIAYWAKSSIRDCLEFLVWGMVLFGKSALKNRYLMTVASLPYSMMLSF